MRQAVFRTRKYDAKMDPEAIRLRFAAQRDNMVEQEEAIFAEIVEVERKAKLVCELAAIPTYQIAAYLAFARQCYSIGKRFTQNSQINEVYYRYQTWINRGLTSAVLDNITELCGVDLGDYPGAP